MNPTAPHDDETELDAWLAAPAAALHALPDGGFSAAVMRRIADEQRHAIEMQRGAMLDAREALARLQRRAARARRGARWHLAGGAVGTLVAAATMGLGSPAAGVNTPAQGLALALALVLAAVLLTAEDPREAV